MRWKVALVWTERILYQSWSFEISSTRTVAFVWSTKNAFYGRCPALDKLDNCSGVDRKEFDNLSTLDELDSGILLNRQKSSISIVYIKFYKSTTKFI